MEENQNNIFEPLTGITKEDILEALKVCLETIHKDIKPTNTLKAMVFHILKSYFLDGKRFVIAECPTGSGKTIIGFMTYFCIQYLTAKKEGYDFIMNTGRQAPKITSYFLTSNKVLQEQIADDIGRFNFHDYMMLLKGVNNYVCIDADKRWKAGEPRLVKKINEKFGGEVPDNYVPTYELRPCANYSGEKLQEKFPCVSDCPYKVARLEASGKSCTILNYAYFLNVMRMVDLNPNTYFHRRLITICDEAHLIPDIVCNMFNLEITEYTFNRINKTIDYIRKEFGNRTIVEDANNIINGALNFFRSPINQASEIINFMNRCQKLVDWLKDVCKAYNSESFNMMYGSTVKDLIEDVSKLIERKDSLTELIYKRPEDLYFESEQVSKNYIAESYKHIIKDLKESQMIRENMLDKMQYGLFMSATIGNPDEYAELMGIRKDEYQSFYLPSSFDFSNSPIYLTKSGWLNYKNFNTDIQKVLADCIKICNMHPTEKGVIHTSTFKVTSILREKLLQTGNQPLINRFLFYRDTKEKEYLIEQFKNSDLPYILVGPSLYEGIDLPDDKCRFQILVKAPYTQLNSYIKKKMTRYPFWYKRNCLEKIVQAIGRSNRHKNDWSKVYLLDNCFNSLIFETNDSIVERIEEKRIY